MVGSKISLNNGLLGITFLLVQDRYRLHRVYEIIINRIWEFTDRCFFFPMFVHCGQSRLSFAHREDKIVMELSNSLFRSGRRQGQIYKPYSSSCEVVWPLDKVFWAFGKKNYLH